MSVTISNPEHFRKSLAFAKSLAPESRRSFQRSLHILNRIKRNGRYGDLTIVPDFVDHSFYWYFKNAEGRKTFDGGMILHGFQETFSVRLQGTAHPEWSIHT